MLYFDSAATTFPSAAAMAGMEEAAKYPANPSSTHGAGREAARFLTLCREKVAASLGVRRLGADRLIFTASGTEANCLALLGSAYAKKRKPVNGSLGTILLSDGEHPSMEAPARRLESEGYTLVHIPTVGGVLDAAALETALAEAVSPVVFAGFMLVNNETGAVYDVKNAFRAVKAKYPDALCHCDAVQGYMKTRFTPAVLGCDTLTVSAHKIRGTRGAGALWLKADVEKKKQIVPVLPGGGQENGYRSGTENLFALGAFAWAAEEEYARFTENREREEALRSLLDQCMAPLYEAGVKAHIPPVHVPGILNISLPGIRSEIMLNALSGRGICVSAGSACSAHSRKESAALKAFGVDAADMDHSIRISLSHVNTDEEIRVLCGALQEELGRLARVR
ncbi:MAG: aminotransferase class V-fold PLP-dependent enzyme [Clostridia bacterium]|nr:aminotransferase class V-fold PLP-dependent enzyme [Clostridia bacterium]